MRYDLATHAAARFSRIDNRKLREHAAEVDLVHLYFDRSADGFFIEVGANEPQRFSQTWQLEQAGWSGILIEPTPALCDQLRAQRPRSVVVQAACSAPDRVGRAQFHIADNSLHSTLAEHGVDFNPQVTQTIDVEVTTLDRVLAEHAPPRIDMVSIDVEGDQLAVLRGFDLAQHRPRLLLIEDHLTDLATHRYLKQRRYRLVKRTGLNNWYMPADAPFALTDRAERWALWRKLYLRTWFRGLRARIRRTLGR
jgi:FkbM family methyltransferase